MAFSEISIDKETLVDRHDINAQLEQISSIDDLKLNAENKYTGLILQQAIKNALSKAKS